MIKKILKLSIIPLLALNCTACRQQPIPKVIQSKAARLEHLQNMRVWQAEGRVAIQDKDQAQNASYTWNQNQDYFKIYFYSPFSSESVTITGDGTQVNITAANGATQEEISLERELPMAQLAYWAKGMPAPGSPPQLTTYDSYNQLQQLQQDDWLVEYQSYQDACPVSLPEKLTLQHAKTKIKLLIKTWLDGKQT